MNTSLLSLLSSNWGWILFRGILSILFGIVAFTWPLITLQVLVLLYGAYVFVDGVIALIAAICGGTLASRWWLALVGIIGILAGLVLFLWPGLGALALLVFIGAVAIVRGIFEIAGAIALRKEIKGEWLLILSGLASILFGVAVELFPGAGALAMVWLIAAYAMAFGLILCVLAFRLRAHGRPRTVHA